MWMIISTETNSPELKTLLNNGWEPFAVVGKLIQAYRVGSIIDNFQYEDIVYLKKKNLPPKPPRGKPKSGV